MSFANKVVIVTGASAGIGAAIALKLAKEDANVILVGRNEARLKKVFDQCQDTGAKCLAIKADLAKDTDIEMIVDKTVERFKRIDVLINNAAELKQGGFLDEDFMEVFNEIFRINLRSAVYLTKLTTPYLIKTKGNVINVTSISGTKVKTTNYLAFCTFKSALDHFSYALALELAPYGVRVNVVAPGIVRTDVFQTAGIECDIEDFKYATALKKIGEAEEIADLVLFLASDKGKSMTGSKYVSDNGMLLMGSIK